MIWHLYALFWLCSEGGPCLYSCGGVYSLHYVTGHLPVNNSSFSTMSKYIFGVERDVSNTDNVEFFLWNEKIRTRVKKKKKKKKRIKWDVLCVVLTALTCFLMFIGRMSGLTLGYVWMVGCTGGAIGTAVGGALWAGTGCLQEVAVRGEISRWLENELLPLQELQLLLHLLLKLLML